MRLSAACTSKKQSYLGNDAQEHCELTSFTALAFSFI